METTRLSSKGQVILPKSVRAAQRWQAGTEFVVQIVEDGVLLKPVRPFTPTRLKDAIGSAGYRGRKRSLEEMEQAIRKGVAERIGRR